MQTRRVWSWVLLVLLLFIFLIVPWISLYMADFVVHDGWFTPWIYPWLYWTAIPGRIFGKPLFHHGLGGYVPFGVAGWATVFLFYTSIAVATWAMVLRLSSLRGKRRI